MSRRWLVTEWASGCPQRRCCAPNPRRTVTSAETEITCTGATASASLANLSFGAARRERDCTERRLSHASDIIIMLGQSMRASVCWPVGNCEDSVH